MKKDREFMNQVIAKEIFNKEIEMKGIFARQHLTVILIGVFFILCLFTTLTFATEVSDSELTEKNCILVLDDSMDPLLLENESMNIELFGNGPKPKKYIYRSNLQKVVYAGKAVGLTTSSKLLNHSLADAPKNLSYANGTTMSNQIKNSSEYKTILKSIKSTLSKTTKTSYRKVSSTTLSSTRDLKLAYNKVSYTVAATKKSGKWTIKITFSDVYDFAYASWKSYSGLGSAAVTILNNYGASAQSVGAVVPYKISVSTTATY